jgi:hypothetical protein
MIEHSTSKGSRSLEKIFADAPEWAIRNTNLLREARGLPLIRNKGVKTPTSERQAAFNKEAAILDRISLLKSEIRLMELQASLR